MDDHLQQLEDWAAPLLAKLEPAARRRLARTVALDLRRSQQRRIAAQRNPDGSPYVARKRLRDKAGRVKRGAMFRKLRTAKHLKVRADASQATVGYLGRVARIARVHQEGLVDRVSPDGPEVRYERRELLGFTEDDTARIRELLIEHLTS